MNFELLQAAIADLIASHPEIDASAAGHNTHADRYITKSGAQIGWRRNLKTQQNLYVAADSVRLSALANIDHDVSLAATRTGDAPNADLFSQGAFSKNQDIVTFKVTEIWQAVRVLAEVAGLHS